MRHGPNFHVFMKCIDYGCPRCLKPFSFHPTEFKPFCILRARKTELEEWFKQHKFAYQTMRQCQWEQSKKKDGRLRMALESVVVEKKHCIMKEGFYGGRTEPTQLYRKTIASERIAYEDFTSLYPSVQYGEVRGVCEDTYNEIESLPFPTGHPIVVRDEFKELSEYFGFIACKVTPPRGLYHPVLPEKKNGKLVFDLLPKEGVWTTVEMMKAVEKGYVIDEIYEIVHFPESRDDLFRDYVTTFLKIKQQAKGWSKLGVDEKDEKAKDLYVQQYHEEQGILLEKSKISEYNHGLYYIAKLCLNSLWGKFAQRRSFPKTEDVFTCDEFEKWVCDDRYELSSVIFHDSFVRTLTLNPKEEFLPLPKKTNIAIAAYTTAYARLRLYSVLEKLGDAVLYYDTDSVIYVYEEGVPRPVVRGDCLGDLTDELNGDSICEFVSVGPKSYAYETVGGDVVCKIKGFGLNFKTSQVLNKEAMEMMIEDNDYEVSVQPLQFDISDQHTISTHQWGDEGKTFKMTCDKRHIDWEHETEYRVNTLPFGF